MLMDVAYQGVINRYRQYLPVTESTPVITLLEGNTPLVRADKLERELGLGLEVYLKYEGLNPTGSFKDRGMTMAITKAVEAGATAVMCASTGNTSASASAYAAKAGLKSIVLIPSGSIALGKLAQACVHGAEVVAVEGNFDNALELVRYFTDTYPVELVNSINPYRIEGQKTAAFEIVDVLGDAPEYHCLPVGNAGNITSYWKGYREYSDLGRCKLPVMLGFQAEGSAPIVRGYRIDDPHTLATAIKIGNPASWQQAEAARDESGGVIDMVSDDEIVEAYRLLARTDGIFCEPASAASVAGLIKLLKGGYFEGKTGRIVCTLTGHGLKDPDRAIAVSPEPRVLPFDRQVVADYLELD